MEKETREKEELIYESQYFSIQQDTLFKCLVMKCDLDSGQLGILPIPSWFGREDQLFIVQ